MWQRIETAHWEGVIRDLVTEHVRETQSRFAERLLIDWDREMKRFWQAIPKAMLGRHAHPVRAAEPHQRRA
ncbi:MAG: hypothetical protein FJX67_08175 [Alphaproteobacteria bacterium]|nr:hypothetical protein [Alphaproteobacteria bacterium]